MIELLISSVNYEDTEYHKNVTKSPYRKHFIAYLARCNFVQTKQSILQYN